MTTLPQDYSWIDEILDENFETHEDDDHTNCASNMVTCSVCGHRTYFMNTMYHTGHTANNTWKADKCDCEYSEKKKTAKHSLIKAIEAEVERASKKSDILGDAYSRVIMRVYDGEKIEQVEPEEMKKANAEIAKLEQHLKRKEEL